MQASIIAQRVEQIRQWLITHNLDAFIIPHEDEFLGEYIPAHNERLQWLTGFAGSAGASIVTKENAAIFVDGRYTVQVTKQVPSDIFSYHHLISEPPIQWIANNLASKSKVAIDPKMHSSTWVQHAKSQLESRFELVMTKNNPIDEVWVDRPQEIASQARLMPLESVGIHSKEKRQMIAAKLQEASADAALLTQLDSICWLLNIRGLDVSRLPVLLSQAIIYQDSSVDFFIEPTRLPKEFAKHVGDNVRVYPPSKLEIQLNQLSQKNIIIDPNTSNAWSTQTLEAVDATLIPAQDPCLLPKAVKNEVEAQGMRNCHVRDGVAMVKFLTWLDDEVAKGNLRDEDELAKQLHQFRAEDKTLADLSFDTISAAGSNAAMCHYNHSDQAEFGKLSMNSLYLVDSGGQYLDGTTDITRTVAIGEPTPFMKQQFTLVLKGHIALATARFPQGTTGSQLDVLARQHLWANGYNFDHGTGHGVGHFLSVHEGPQRISPAHNPTALQVGMVLSNEPGYYQENDFGIRIENLEIVSKVETDGNLDMLGFESLTRCPIDVRVINFNLLTQAEKNWLNDYHKKVWDDLSPLVSGEVKSWLEEATAEI